MRYRMTCSLEPLELAFCIANPYIRYLYAIVLLQGVATLGKYRHLLPNPVHLLEA